MAYLSDYTAGTVTVSGTTVTGSGTAWQTAQFREGDWFIADGWVGIVASVESNTSATLVAWAGPDLSGAPYRMRYMSDGSRASAQARQLIDLLGGSGSLEALAALIGLPNTVPMFTGPGQMTLVPRTDFVSGVNYDVQVNTLADRAAYNAQPVGFSVLVSNIGNGRSAVYARVGAAGNWTDPAFVTGPAITLDVTEVDEVPYGTPPDVTLTPVTGGYNLAFDIPRGMIIEPGTTTTLPPDQDAEVTFVPITGGFRLDIAIPRGPTGDIDGVTPFWVTRLGSDTDAAAALTGLGFSEEFKTLVGRNDIRANELAAVNVGTRNVSNSSDSAILISRLVGNEKSENGHAFSDSSSFNRGQGPGIGWAYNSFDARCEIDGSYNYNHYAGFQCAPFYRTTGTTVNHYGYFSGGSVLAGQITNFYGGYSANPGGTGTIQNLYGFYVPQITRGTTRNYAFYSAGNTPSYFNTMPETGVEGRKIIERGSNANGDFVRFADGTQICYFQGVVQASATSSYGTLFQGLTSLTFPSSFTATPSVSVEARWGTGAGWGGIGSTPSTTQVSIRLLDTSSRASGDTLVSMIAIGRWF